MKKNDLSNQPANTLTYVEALKILTPRETEVLDFVERGYTNKEIAEELYLSVRSIQTHRNNICRKLNIKGRLGLMKWLPSNRSGYNNG